jgi:hypothetical protein
MLKINNYPTRNEQRLKVDVCTLHYRQNLSITLSHIGNLEFLHSQTAPSSSTHSAHTPTQHTLVNTRCSTLHQDNVVFVDVGNCFRYDFGPATISTPASSSGGATVQTARTATDSHPDACVSPSSCLAVSESTTCNSDFWCVRRSSTTNREY